MTQERIRRKIDADCDDTKIAEQDFPIPGLDNIPSKELDEKVTTVFFGGSWFKLARYERYKGYVDWHWVFVSHFYIRLRPVTIGEWKELMGSYEPKFSIRDTDDRPADVNWNDIIHYCNKLSLKDGLQQCYAIQNGRILCDFNSNGYRLPTEAEFNYATPFYRYRIGKELDIIPKVVPLNWCDIPSLPQGDRDLIFAYQSTWVWDIFDSQYHKSNPIDPAGADNGELHVRRIYPPAPIPSNNAFKAYRDGLPTDCKNHFFLTRSWVFETEVRKNNLINMIPQWDR